RRRHTRFSRDWSSDVCSSDLDLEGVLDAVVAVDQRPCDVVPPVHVGHRQFDLAPVLDEPLTEPHVANPVRARPQDVEVGVVQDLHARTPTPRRPHSMAVAWTHIPALLDSWTL